MECIERCCNNAGKACTIKSIFMMIMVCSLMNFREVLSNNGFVILSIAKFPYLVAITFQKFRDQARYYLKVRALSFSRVFVGIADGYIKGSSNAMSFSEKNLTTTCLSSSTSPSTTLSALPTFCSHLKAKDSANEGSASREALTLVA